MDTVQAERDHAQFVFDRLLQSALYRGKYDARNGLEDYMYGIFSVMDAVASMVSEECSDRFTKEFAQNMNSSIARAKIDAQEARKGDAEE